MAKVGVLLLNLGGPERIQDVGPFLYNLFSDPTRPCRNHWPG
jgi:protoporphyrin/coproporphyrin ferrochelatase